MKQPRILMCAPDYYGIEYEINPWMSRSRGSTPVKAIGQWSALVEILRRLGVQFPQPTLDIDARLRAVVARSDRWQSRFPRALAIRAATERGVADAITPLCASTDPLIHETVAWAIAPPPAKENAPMLLIEKVILLKTVPMFALTLPLVVSTFSGGAPCAAMKFANGAKCARSAGASGSRGSSMPAHR